MCLLQLICLLSIGTHGQKNHVTLGSSEAGICIGNSESHSGLRFNLIDDSVSQINGINISGISKAQVVNGLTFGLLANMDDVSNGILINGFVGETLKANGLVISGLGHVSSEFNGLGIGGLAVAGDYLNGLFISPIGVTYWNTEKIKIVNGVAIGLIIGSNTEKMNGLSLSLFNNVCETLNGVAISALNRTDELHGIQIGLWNVAENNRIFKKFPLVNINFRKKTTS
jgi:hypothetical protein